MAQIHAPKASDYAIVLEGAAGAIRMAPDVLSEYLQAIENKTNFP
jgi:hypothetical protein